MEAPEKIRDRLLARFPGSEVTLLANPAPAALPSLLLGAAQARAMAEFVRDDPALRLDYCSNVTGVDWPEKEIVETVKRVVPDPAGGPSKTVDEKVKRRQPGCLEVVYHLFSVSQRHGPLVVRMRTANRGDQITLPSFTPVWRSCEFQEREVFDLFGVIFSDHPDLRRILMWDEFKDHPMRKDYVEPDDYEWEPTPHDAVAQKAQKHHP
jgi:NADH-quinone oxidoreductase subunit C